METSQPLVAQDVSLIIPCNHSSAELVELLAAVYRGTLVPGEIVIIRSACQKLSFGSFSSDSTDSVHSLIDFPSVRGVNINVINTPAAFPGEARNIGVMNARGEIIAFLDIKTLPKREWLEEARDSLENSNCEGIWGMGVYESSTTFGRLIRDAIYGRQAVRTLPGSVFRRRVFTVTGHMISWTPAGEDGDWIHRIEAHKLLFLMPKKANHSYHGLDEKSLLFFIKKWWRYYHYSRLLPLNNRDRWLSFGLMYITLIFFAFNWNYKISSAIFGSPLVVPHITTVLLIAGPCIYFYIRGIYLPLRRGVSLINIFPVRFILLLLVACTLDFVKTLALLLPQFNSERGENTALS